MDNILKKQFQIRAFDVDFSGRIKLTALLNFLQESAAEHAHKLGVSMEEMAKKNLAWILSRYHVLLSRYPFLGQTLFIKTWPSVRQGTYSLREFEVSDNKGPILQATTSWLAIDIQRKKPVRIADVLPDFPLHSRRAINDSFEPLSPLQKTDLEMEFPVLRDDLDLNRHVNNVVYIKWAVETIPEKILLKFRPVEIEINYRAEVFYGDRIISQTQKKADDNIYNHQLFRSQGRNELARLITRWADV